MKQLILPVDTSKIEDQSLKKFIKTLQLKAYLEIEENIITITILAWVKKICGRSV